MSFETHDFAPPIETAGFSPALLAAPESAPAEAAAMLVAALREAGHGAQPGADFLIDRAAARAEANVLDLWIDRSAGGSNLRALERPGAGLSSGTSLQGWAALIGDDAALSRLLDGHGSVIDSDTALRAALGEEDENDGGSGPIVVKGRRDADEDEPGDIGGGYGDGGYGDGGTGGGGGGNPSIGAHKVADHTQDCGTDDGAAVQVAKKVIGLAPGSGPPNPLMSGGDDWKHVEYGAVIVRNPDGTYGALNDAIYSNGSPTFIRR